MSWMRIVQDIPIGLGWESVKVELGKAGLNINAAVITA